MKVANELVPIIYQTAREVWKNNITRTEGVELLVVNKKMNPNTATDCIDIFRKMVEGKTFKRDLNAFSLSYYLENILSDYGQMVLSKALYAVSGYIDFNEKLSSKKMHKARRIYEIYLKHLPIIDPDEVEQNEIIADIKPKTLSKRALLEEIQKVKESDAEMIEFKGKAYKRDNKTIASIKILHEFQCQICGVSIMKRDGNRYIEAAHIKPKHLKGREILSNIILLCPNHHKEFDLGNSRVENHSNESVDVYLNGAIYHIEFEPKFFD